MRTNKRNRCKPCHAAHALTATRAYQARNRELCAERTRSWRISNPEKSAAYRKEYLAANRDRILAQNAKWRAENPEKNLASYTNYYRNNRETILEKKRLRRLALKTAKTENSTNPHGDK